MNKNIKNTLRIGIIAAAGAAAMISCSDTWDDHYKDAALINFDGTTMQAIEANAPDFAEVIKAVGYDRELSSENVYTIWAPTNFNKDSVLNVARTDSAAVVDRFIKNHVARYALSLNGTEQDISLMSSKLALMTGSGETGTFGSSRITKANMSCSNGLLHLINTNIVYQNNVFEQIHAMYNASTDSVSLYAFLQVWNADSLDENKSVSRGVDENGDKIWVDSVTIRNNTVLKNVDALIYEEDSSYIAIIPSAKAYEERVNLAKSLLVFNPIEDVISPGACDSLQNYHANMFAMTDLFYNKNANQYMEDSLKSTVYSASTWPYNLYYSKVPRAGLHPDKQLNDILSKCGTPIECSNGEAYSVDEYPMSITEQFFKKINVMASNRTLDATTDDNGSPMYSKFIGTTSMRSGTIYDYDYQTDSIWLDSVNYQISRHDSVYVGTRSYYFFDVEPSSSSVQPQIAFQVKNTLSGTYDLYLVTCPIWAKTGFNNGEAPEDDPRPYRFRLKIWERGDDGKYPADVDFRPVPEEDGLSEGNYFMTDYHNKIDTLYLGDYTFKNAYYGRNDEGVLIQILTSVTSRQTNIYSREMLICGLILKPKTEGTEEAVAEAKRK